MEFKGHSSLLSAADFLTPKQSPAELFVVFNYSQTKFVAIILVLSVFFMRFFA